MGKNSGISWTHHTFNPWWGCEKPLVQIGGHTVVSPECVSCYAETWDARCGGAHWGHTAPRRDFGDKHWREPLTWNAQAQKQGERYRVFCASMGDILEDRRDLDRDRARLWDIIHVTPSLDWMLLTKRADLLEVLVPPSVWALPNVWPGVTAGVQETADLRLPHLFRLKHLYPHLIAWVSAEPLLDSVTLAPWLPALDLVIVGGESGTKARPMHPLWARLLRDECARYGVAYFFKQWGEWYPLTRTDGIHEMPFADYHPASHFGFTRVGTKKAGDTLDGQRHQEIPRAEQRKQIKGQNK